MQSIEERAAAAYELKATGKCNCSQSVVKVFQDKLPVGEDTLMKLTAGYAAGMGCMESTCGALVGAVMVAGILTDGIATPRISKELLQKFEAKCGATICKDLKGIPVLSVYAMQCLHLARFFRTKTNGNSDGIGGYEA